MAQKVNIILVDDLDGTEADETVTFSIDGNDYAIDLTSANAQKLRDAVAPFVAHARRETRSAGRRRSSGGSSSGPKPAEIREWARANGHTVPDRGRIPGEVREAYDAAN